MSPRLIAHYDLKLSYFSQLFSSSKSSDQIKEPVPVSHVVFLPLWGKVMSSLSSTRILKKIFALMQLKWIKLSEKWINVNASNHTFYVSNLPWCQLFNLEWCQAASWKQIMQLVNTKATVAAVFTGLKGITVFKEWQTNITDWITLHILYSTICPIYCARWFQNHDMV